MLTKMQLEERLGFLGASEMASVLGLNDYESAYDLWLKKIGCSKSESTDSLASRVGTALEPIVLAGAEETLGKIQRPTKDEPLVFEMAGTPLRASLDGLIIETGEPVDSKTSGLFGRTNDEWGAAGSDEVPAPYVVQLHVQMMCVDPECKRGYVAALLGGRGQDVHCFPVKRDERICDAILKAASAFWQRVEHARRDLTAGIELTSVIAAHAPPDSVPSLEILKRVARTPEKIIEFGDEQLALVEEWQTAAKANTEAGKRADAAKARVILALGDAEAARAGAHGAVTYLESQRAGYVVAASTVRTLRIRKKGI